MLGKAIKKIFDLERKIRKPEIIEKNRKLVGVDRIGNQYFQHFSDEGYESKREVVYYGDHYDFRKIEEKSIDPFWNEWVAGRQKKPFTPEEYQQLITEYENRLNLGRQASENLKNEQGINNSKSYEQGSKQHQTYKANNPGENYQPGSWGNNKK